MSVVRTDPDSDGTTRSAPDVASRAIRDQVYAWQASYRRGILLIDLACAVVSAVTAFCIRFVLLGSFSVAYTAATVAFPMLWLGTLMLLRAYESRFLHEGTEEYRKVIQAGAALMVAVAVASYLANADVARGWLILLLPMTTTSTLVLRYAWRRRLHRRRWMHGECMRRAVIVGYERSAANLCRTLSRDRFHGLQVVGACLPPHRLAVRSSMVIEDCGVPVLGSFADIDDAVAAVGADVVVVLGCPELDGVALRRLSWKLERSDTTLLVAPALLEVAGPRVTVRPVADLPLLHVEHIELTGWRRLLKSSFDKVVSGLGLLLLSPFLLGLALAIKLSDRGPVLFRQSRVGQDGREFVMLKFRTMVPKAEARLTELLPVSDGDGVLFKMRTDPRVTRLGGFLRRYSLDELPQLVNVLRGEMSLVGPRPPLRREVERYESDVHRRFVVRPGITGLWQVSGRSDLPWEEAVRLDIRYVERWSLLLDMLIVCRTVGAVLRKSGAY